MHTKLRRLGFPNQIVDDSKSDSNKIRRWNPSDWNPFSILYCQLRIRSIFDLFLIKIDWFQRIFDWNIKKDHFKDWKSLFKDQKVEFIWKSLYILTFLISFDHFWYKFDIFQVNSKFLMHFWAAGINLVTTNQILTTNLDQKSWLKADWIVI